MREILRRFEWSSGVSKLSRQAKHALDALYRLNLLLNSGPAILLSTRPIPLASRDRYSG